MGFTVYYCSIDPVDAAERAAIESACDDLCDGRSWISCEPVLIFSTDGDGHLNGGSKLNFSPDPEEAADAAAEGLSDGTIRDVMKILCKLSTNFGIEWEVSHDESNGPIGYVRGGVADADVLVQIDAIASCSDFLNPAEIDDAPRADNGPTTGLRLFDPDAE